MASNHPADTLGNSVPHNKCGRLHEQLLEHKTKTGMETITEVRITLGKSDLENHPDQPAAGVHGVGKRCILLSTVKYSSLTNEKTKVKYHLL